jgi:hypothetical protein
MERERHRRVMPVGLVRTLTVRPWIVPGEVVMDSIIYLVGLIVVVMFILSALGLR